MSPRALTNEEKATQKNKLLEVATKLILENGIKEVTVSYITESAGFAKGSFYNYFISKEDLLLQLVWNIYDNLLKDAEKIILSSSKENLRDSIGKFIMSFISDADKVFFFMNHDEIEDLLNTMESEYIKDFNDLERQAFTSLLKMAKIDISIVKPEVVHNYLHAIYFASYDDSLISEFLNETLSIMLEGLLNYIFQENL